MDDELDLDGDGVADVRVPGLPGPMVPAAGTDELVDTSPAEAVAGADLPPTSSPYSPMGRIEHMGYALNSQTARRGWRRKAIVIGALVWLGIFITIALIGLLA